MKCFVKVEGIMGRNKIKILEKRVCVGCTLPLVVLYRARELSLDLNGLLEAAVREKIEESQKG